MLWCSLLDPSATPPARMAQLDAPWHTYWYAAYTGQIADFLPNKSYLTDEADKVAVRVDSQGQ